MRSILATLVMLPGFAFAATPPMCYKVVAEQGSTPLVANK